LIRELCRAAAGVLLASKPSDESEEARMPTLKIPDREIDYETRVSSRPLMILAPGGMQASIGRLSRFPDRHTPR
jgi:hypothetical protein